LGGGGFEAEGGLEIPVSWSGSKVQVSRAVFAPNFGLFAT
jgi:hypothetical protein